MARHAGLAREVGADRVGPALDRGVPQVGRVEQVGGVLVEAEPFRDRGGQHQGRDLDRQREGRIAAVLLPPVLTGRRAVLDQVAGRLPHHGPEPVKVALAQCAFLVGLLDEDDRERRFVHLDAVPVGFAVEPHVLRPVTVLLLRGLQVGEHVAGIPVGPDGQQGGRRLDEVARPDQVVAAQVAVALGGTPGDRQAGDQAALEGLRLVGAQHAGRHPVGVLGAFRAGTAVEVPERRLPGLPFGHVAGFRGRKTVHQAAARPKSRIEGVAPERHGQHHLAVLAEIEFAAERHVAVGGPVVQCLEDEIPPEQGVAVAFRHEADRQGLERGRGRHRQGDPVARRGQHGPALDGFDRRGVVGTRVDQVGGREREDAVVTRAGLRGVEPDALQDDVADRVGDDALLDHVAAVAAAVRHRVARHAGSNPAHGGDGVALLLRQVAGSVGDDEAEVAQARFVGSGEVDLVQDAVADREADARQPAQRAAHPGLGAGRPARLAAGPAGGIAEGCGHVLDSAVAGDRDQRRGPADPGWTSTDRSAPGRCSRATSAGPFIGVL